MSDLQQLFPNLPPAALADWDKPPEGTNTEFRNPAVTDADVERYITSQAGRILNPSVTNQQAPPTPEFANNGRPAPPATSSYVEGPDTTGASASTPPESPSAPSVSSTPPGPAHQEPEIPPSPGELDTPPLAGAPDTSAEGEPPLTPDAPTEPPAYTIGGRPIATRQLEALVQFNDEIAADPQLRALLTQYYQTRQLPQPQQLPPSPVLPQPATLPQPGALPQLTAEDLADPAVAALYAHVQAQQQTLAQLQQQTQYAQQAVVSTQQREIDNIVNSAKSAFQTKYQLTAEHMAEIERAAAGSGAVRTYMNGMDPITMSPVTPNQYKAIERALEIGYYNSPTVRQLDYERRQARAANDAARRAKLAGVSGSGGSVSRTAPPAPSPRDAMIAEVSQMMSGTWSQ